MWRSQSVVSAFPEPTEMPQPHESEGNARLVVSVIYITDDSGFSRPGSVLMGICSLLSFALC